MPWIFFLLALGCIALAMRTQSMGFALLLLLASLGLMLAGALGLLSARIQSRSQGGGMQLNPALERERLRQQREASGKSSSAVVTAENPAVGSRREAEPDAGSGDGGGD
ncbi:hypothetical protein [Pseudomarimonas salicorniae]|uniref:Uncharacterized protein n=1 Tax=Pseudomarimonas salicorniae TaxID=2933270 RepID=A0ABT0GGB0_9GAMM|nr:hypothetical protein [Lysobacter sp. CAU 1642]MCK7593571.1 hypothetical protein [Lysobacter sp. CAU 1642]